MNFMDWPLWAWVPLALFVIGGITLFVANLIHPMLSRRDALAVQPKSSAPGSNAIAQTCMMSDRAVELKEAALIYRASEIMKLDGKTEPPHGFTARDVEDVLEEQYGEYGLTVEESRQLDAGELSDDYKPDGWYGTIGDYKTLLAFRKYLNS